MPGINELLIILFIVALLFGTKKLRSMGGDFGSAINSFRNAMKENGADTQSQQKIKQKIKDSTKDQKNQDLKE